MEDSLKKRYSIKLSSNIITGLINIVIVAIVPKALGPIVFGQFSYLQQFFNQVTALLDAGTSTAFFTKLSAKQERKELLKFYFIFANLLFSLLISIVFLFDLLSISNYFLADIPMTLVYFGGLLGFLTWLTQIYIKISDAYALTVSAELVKIAHKTLMLLFLLYIINYLAFDLTIYFYYNYFSAFTFLCILTYLFMRKKVLSFHTLMIKVEYKNLTREFMQFSSPVFIFSLVAIGISLFDIWLLQKVSGSVETGFYGLAYSIAAMCFLFTSAMTPVISREFSLSYVKKDITRMKTLFSRYVPMLYAVSAFFGVFIAFESENLLNIFTDNRFQDAYLALMLMAFYPIHQTYGQLNASLLFASEQTRLYRNIGLFSSLIGLFFSVCFIYYFELGALGFALKMIITQFISVNIQLVYNAKFLKLDIKPLLSHQIYSILFLALPAYICSHFFNFWDEPLYNFIFSGFLYSILSLVGIITFPAIVNLDRVEIQKITKRALTILKR